MIILIMIRKIKFLIMMKLKMIKKVLKKMKIIMMILKIIMKKRILIIIIKLII
jgi:hypothetical protein